VKVFMLEHVYIRDDGEEQIKLIGVYSTAIAAEQAIQRLRTQPGFRDTPEGFSVSEITIDRDHWVEGFVTVDPDDA
jgi:hypothetical protein